MMKCPDIDRLIEVTRSGGPGPEIRRHLSLCANCEEILLVLEAIPRAFEPDVEVSEWLVSRTVARLTPEAFSRPSPRGRWSQRLVAGLAAALLGTLTTLVAVVMSPVGGTPGINRLLVFSLALGVAAGFNEIRYRDHGSFGPDDGI